MADHTLFVGLDVHKRTIAVATAPDTAGKSCTYYGTVANTPDALAAAVQEAGDRRHAAGERAMLKRARDRQAGCRQTFEMETPFVSRPHLGYPNDFSNLGRDCKTTIH
jgi:hypothetical protein